MLLRTLYNRTPLATAKDHSVRKTPRAWGRILLAILPKTHSNFTMYYTAEADV